jgi:hypothetical protein
MRKIDRKLNFQKANLIAEQTYLKSKGLLEEHLGYGFQEETMYEEPMQPEMEMEAPMPMHEEPQMDIKNTLRQLEPKDIQGKENYLRELESFVQELRYVIKREQEGM